MLKGLFQVNKNKYLFATHPFLDISLLSLPTPTSPLIPSLRDPSSKMTRVGLELFLGGNDSFLQKERTDTQLPQTVGTLYVQKGELDGDAHGQSEATLDSEVVGPGYLLVQCLPAPS